MTARKLSTNFAKTSRIQIVRFMLDGVREITGGGLYIPKDKALNQQADLCVRLSHFIPVLVVSPVCIPSTRHPRSDGGFLAL